MSGELAELSVRLEGIPLAIELAAGLADAMTVSEIRERLNDRFRLLTGGGRSTVSRHQTLRQAVDWSYDLLSSAEQALFVRLAVFAGGFVAKAAESVGGPDRLPTLLRLVDKSLVVAEARGLPSMRYRLLDTLREYAFEKLQHRELVDARGKHTQPTSLLSARKPRQAPARRAKPVASENRGRGGQHPAGPRVVPGQSARPLMLLTGLHVPLLVCAGKFMEASSGSIERSIAKVAAPESRLAPLQIRRVSAGTSWRLRRLSA